MEVTREDIFEKKIKNIEFLCTTQSKLYKITLDDGTSLIFEPTYTHEEIEHCGSTNITIEPNILMVIVPYNINIDFIEYDYEEMYVERGGSQIK